MRRNAFLIAALFIVGGIGMVAAQGMMGPGRGGWGGMMGGWWDSPPPGTAQALSIDQVAEIVQDYLNKFWNKDLAIHEVMEFDNQFYADVKEKSTGIFAFQLLVNKWTGDIVPEPGPNMMWNAKYSPMGMGMMGGGMMGGPGWGWGGGGRYRNKQDPSKEMAITLEQARQYAQAFLDARLPGTKVEDSVDVYYGYYTIDVMKNGEEYGMLGVNGYSGGVWYHTWHGNFVRMKDLDRQQGGRE
jgi:hypothetical protein